MPRAPGDEHGTIHSVALQGILSAWAPRRPLSGPERPTRPARAPPGHVRRFKRRLDDPKRQWKISDADYKERKYWDAYTEAYEEALSRCNTGRAPWFIIPSDCKWFRNLAVARIVVHYLKGLKLQAPAPTVDLEAVRKEFEDAEKEVLAKHR